VVWVEVILILFYFIHGIGALTQGFVHGRQVLYLWVSTPDLVESYFMLPSLVKIPLPWLSWGNEFTKIVILEYFFSVQHTLFWKSIVLQKISFIVCTHQTISHWPRCKWRQIIGFILMEFCTIICWHCAQIWILLVKERLSVILQMHQKLFSPIGLILLHKYDCDLNCFASVYISSLIQLILKK
jgi:hypothetical protein